MSAPIRRSSPRNHSYPGGWRNSTPRTPNASGVHFLRDPGVAHAIIRAAEVGPGSLVLEFGAGAGALTVPLARTGARVLAVERDPAFVRRLEKRFNDCLQVRVVHADLRTIPLPRRPFTVVANIPFEVSTDLLRRLLSADRTGFTAAQLLVEWGFAKRVTAPCPRDLEMAWWAARFDLRLVRRVPAHAFAPAPTVDAAHLSIRRVPGLNRQAGRSLRTLIHTVYADPAIPAGQAVRVVVLAKRAHRLLTSSGIDPPIPAGRVPIRQWRDVVLANQRLVRSRR